MPELRPTFEVDKEGLAKLMSRRGPSFALLELLQNAWDEASTVVRVTLDYEGDDRCLLTVEDDNPTGFANLAHAYTLFADSAKKGEAEKRGRFNLGEKLVIAICDHAEVSTTTGTIRFNALGRQHFPDETRDAGSVFTGLLRMTDKEYAAAIREIRTVIVPANVRTEFNGEEIPHRTPLRSFATKLLSEIADDEGRLKRTWRVGKVNVYAVKAGEQATIYEMGIPVVSTEDRWHVDVGQKVPLNVDRDNVTPAYLKDLRRAVLNACHDLLDEEASGENWISDAIEDPEITGEALNAALDLRYGEKRVAYDPSDKEANHIAAAQGYTVIGSRSLPKQVWTNVRAHSAILPAGQVTPSPSPYQPGQENARSVLPQDEWTSGMVTFAAFAAQIAEPLVGVTDLKVEFINDQTCRNFLATWTRAGEHAARLEYNIMTLGRAYFNQEPTAEKPLSLLIHEMGHQRGGGNHLSDDYYRELTDLGARATRLALTNPGVFSLMEAAHA